MFYVYPVCAVYLPVHCLINNLSIDLFFISGMGFRLRQVDLCNAKLWKGVSMSLLSQVIEKFASENLFKLYFPRFNLKDVNDASIGEFMDSLLKARSLKEIDFGRQAERLSAKQLSILARGLPSLERVIAYNIT